MREAIDWLLRLDAADAPESDWLAFQLWIAAAPENLEAYEQAQRVTAELAAAAPALSRALDTRSIVPAPRRLPSGRRPQWRARIGPAVAGLAAAAAAVIVVVAVRPAPPVTPDVYQTAKGESRMLDLADGSHVYLNSASRLSVRLER